MHLLTISEVASRLSICRASLWKLTKEPDFPKPVLITKQRKAFVAAEIDAWISQRVADRDQGVAR